MESFFDRQLSVSVDQWGTLSKVVGRLWDSTEIYTTPSLSTFSVTNLRAFWQFSTNSLLIRHPPTNSVFVSPTYVGFCQILSNIQLSRYNSWLFDKILQPLSSTTVEYSRFMGTPSDICHQMSYKRYIMKFFVTWCRGLTPIDWGSRILVTFCRIIENSTRWDSVLLFIFCLVVIYHWL